MIRSIHRLCGALVVLGLATVTAGCGGGTGDPPRTRSLEKTTLTVAAVPAGDSAGLYVAQQQGYFRDAGLTVKIVPAVSSATAISQQLSGRYDVTAGNYVSYIEADAQRHAGLRVIAEGSVMRPDIQEILTPARSPVTSVAGLRGKTIGVNVQGNIGTILVGTALQENGVPLSSVHLKAIPFPQMASALKAHQVDAAWLPEPFASTAEEQIGAQQLFDTDQGSTKNFPVQGYVVTRAWQRKYPNTAAAFTRALERGQATADSSRADVETAMQRYASVPRATAAVMAIDNYPLGVDRTRLQRVADAMLRFGLLTKPYNVGPMVG